MLFLCLILSELAWADESTVRAQVAAQVRQNVESNYYSRDLGPLPWDQVNLDPGLSDAEFYQSLNRVLAQLKDQHTSAESPTMVRAERESSRQGIGLDARYIDQRLAVVNVVESSPVESLGVKRGWVVRSINESQVPDSEPQFLSWMRKLDIGALCETGPLKLSLADERDQPRDIEAKCTELAIRPRRESRLIGDALYVHFDRFDADSANWFLSQLAAHSTANKLVLDLRGNRGGQRSALLRIAGGLMGKQRLGQSMARRGRVTPWVGNGKKLFNGQMVVLTANDTMSAAEILAGALQEHQLAKVLGRPSGGSVLAMVRRRLPDGGELRLSVEDFVLPNGKRLEGTGVKTDQLLPFTLTHLRQDNDADLEAALAALR